MARRLDSNVLPDDVVLAEHGNEPGGFAQLDPEGRVLLHVIPPEMAEAGLRGLLPGGQPITVDPLSETLATDLWVALATIGVIQAPEGS